MRHQQGEYNVCRKGNVIFFDGEGPWDVMAVNNFYNDVVKLTHANFKNDSWALLALFRGNSFFPPDSEQQSVESLISLKDKGLTMLAAVTLESKADALINYQMTKIFDLAQLEAKFTTTKNEALEWLKSRGFSD
jgi:hypothetical protein